MFLSVPFCIRTVKYRLIFRHEDIRTDSITRRRSHQKHHQKRGRLHRNYKLTRGVPAEHPLGQRPRASIKRCSLPDGYPFPYNQRFQAVYCRRIYGSCGVQSLHMLQSNCCNSIMNIAEALFLLHHSTAKWGNPLGEDRNTVY